MEQFKISPNGRYLALQGSSEKGGGFLNVLDAATLQWIAQARVEGLKGIADFCWWSDSQGICVAAKNGEITEWSMSHRRAIARWRDEGAVGTTVMALGGRSGRHVLGGDRWIAVGSSAGIVNIYDRREWAAAMSASAEPDDAANVVIPSNPKPVKMLDNLLHPITHLSFSPDGQILCMSSRFKSRALRLVHLPSCTVYKNWPTQAMPTGRVSSMDWGWSEEGQLLLVLGCESGRIMVFEVRGS